MPSVGENMEQPELSRVAVGSVMVQPLGRTGKQFLIKVNIHLLYDPAIPFLSIYLREINTYVHKKDFYMNILFIIIAKS